MFTPLTKIPKNDVHWLTIPILTNSWQDCVTYGHHSIITVKEIEDMVNRFNKYLKRGTSVLAIEGYSASPFIVGEIDNLQCKDGSIIVHYQLIESSLFVQNSLGNLSTLSDRFILMPDFYIDENGVYTFESITLISKEE